MGNWKFALIATLAMGCGSEAAEQETSAGGDSAETASEEAPAVAAVTLPEEEAEVSVELSEEEHARLTQEEELAALGEAAEAARDAQGSTPCERAYNGAMAMVEVLRRRRSASASDGVPTRQNFISLCETLPPQAQNCITMNYAMANQDECSRVMQSEEVLRFRDGVRATMTAP